MFAIRTDSIALMSNVEVVLNTMPLNSEPSRAISEIKWFLAEMSISST